ncbi:DUF2779 domain-containing protein [candidate division KSB1 bacterium]
MIVSVKEQVIAMQDEIRKRINELKQMLAKPIPAIDIGPYCDDPFTCDFHGHCWKHIPEYSVFDIGNLWTSKKFDLYYKGITELKDIPEDSPLNDNQWMQVECEINEKIVIEKGKLKEFKKQFQYPLYFLDFETFQSAIPLYDNSKPYQQIPFQYSLHVQKEKGGPIDHYEFLGTPPDDPRIPFIDSLISQIETNGSIVVYNQGFETARLREIARDFPQNESQINKILNRIVDLMIPFHKRWYYTPAMKGSYSIKYVLPALVPELSYQNLEIQEGGTASLIYESLYEDTDHASVQTKRKNLLEYCKMDTLAMVMVLERIE